jgi:hypothetical protein
MNNNPIKFYYSNLTNKMTLLTTVLIFLTAILFAFSKKVQLSVVAIWISAGSLWLLRYGWQIKNPYINITDDEMTINKSPIIKKKVKIVDIEKILKITRFNIIISLRNTKKIKISLFPIEKSERKNLITAINKIADGHITQSNSGF